MHKWIEREREREEEREREREMRGRETGKENKENVTHNILKFSTVSQCIIVYHST